jgi:hypothetical protein
MWVAGRESNAERHRKLAQMAALKSVMKEAESTSTILVGIFIDVKMCMSFLCGLL